MSMFYMHFVHQYVKYGIQQKREQFGRVTVGIVCIVPFTQLNTCMLSWLIINENKDEGQLQKKNHETSNSNSRVIIST